MKTAVTVALAIGLATPALAATSPEAKKLAGAWTMSAASEGGGSCKLKLGSDAAAGGWGLAVPPACAKAFPRLKDAAAWTLYDGKAIGILNPTRQRIYRFEKTGDGDYVTARNRDGDQFVLAKGPSAKELTPQQRMSGGWSVAGLGGKPRCAYTSKANKAGTEGTLVAKASPTCPANWKSVGWARWNQKGGKLDLLNDKGKVTHTLKKADAVTYEGETKAGAPLYFTRD
jgi:hypothetical protein